MLRASAILLVAALLAGSSLWLTWGEKEVTYNECALLDGQRVCETLTIRAKYDPKALNGVLVRHVQEGSQEPESDSRAFWHPYDEPADADALGWWRSPVLALARPLLLAGLVVGPVAVGAAWALRERRPRVAPYPPLVAAVVLGLGAVAALGGLLLHAGTWAANRVEPLRATPGTVVLFAAGFLGLVGGLRMHALLHDAAAGRTGDSPLVPAERLFGFEVEEADAETGTETEPDAEPTPWTWPRAALAVAAVALLVLPLLSLAPLASKDITLRECHDVPGRGGVCAEQALAVEYHAGHARLWSVHVSDDPVPKTTRTYEDDVHYFGAWQDAHGGPAWMGLGAVATVLGAAGVVASFGVRQERRRTLARAAAGTLLAGFLLTTAAVAWQAGTWVGAPAGRSHPEVGAWSALLGLALLAGWTLGPLRDDAPATDRRPQRPQAAPTKPPP